MFSRCDKIRGFGVPSSHLNLRRQGELKGPSRSSLLDPNEGRAFVLGQRLFSAGLAESPHTQAFSPEATYSWPLGTLLQDCLGVFQAALVGVAE